MNGQENQSELQMNVQEPIEEAEESQLRRGYHIGYPY